MRCLLLEEDVELGSGLADDELAAASAALPVVVVEIGPGDWTPPDQQPERQCGYLLLDGKLLREVRIFRDWNAELLLSGDVLRPWLEDSASFTFARWTALERSRLAVLDIVTIQRMARWGPLLDAFLERIVKRSRSLAAHAAIESMHRVEDRLLLLFWHIAERCGRIEDGNVVAPIELTHEELSRLVGAQRPTVSSALMELSRAGKLQRQDDGWILSGEPPRPEFPGGAAPST